MKRRIVPLIFGFVAAASVAAQAMAQPDGGVLVTPQWLTARLDDPAVRIVDLGKSQEQFRAGHIPNASFVDWRIDLVDPARAEYFDVASQARIEALLSRLGIRPDDTVVLYDSQSSRLSARMFWILRYYGHRDIRILDGGSGAWDAGGGAQSVAVTNVPSTQYRFVQTHARLRAERSDVEAAMGRADAALVDARAPQFYSGESIGSTFGSDTPNAKAGHIPGAENFFWNDHFNADGTFKSAVELAARYSAIGIRPDQQVISYCHVGLQASTPWFVLSELLGYPDVRLYDSSMAEWANADATALTVGAD